jgi:ubiquinone/menaquinone biosynthesis C-methylase UbiE
VVGGSGLVRIPEPELMDEPAQARAYSDADFSGAHNLFVSQIKSRFGPLSGEVLDLGCGPADPTVRLAIANPAAAIVGIDAGPMMLDLARERVRGARLDDRIRLEQRRLPDASLGASPFDAVVSNSLLHHLPDPMVLWETVARCTRPGGIVAVMDLLRPADLTTLDQLVAGYAADGPSVLQADFRNSLLAAYLLDEVEAQIEVSALENFSIEQISDRHLFVGGVRR